jgi:hypothetical protein
MEGCWVAKAVLSPQGRIVSFKIDSIEIDTGIITDEVFKG